MNGTAPLERHMSVFHICHMTSTTSIAVFHTSFHSRSALLGYHSETNFPDVRQSFETWLDVGMACQKSVIDIHYQRGKGSRPTGGSTTNFRPVAVMVIRW